MEPRRLAGKELQYADTDKISGVKISKDLK